jgi:predicted transcriptional regulator
MARKHVDRLGGLQRAIMEAVWDAGRATVREVHARVGARRGLAYTTVLSAMQKLERRGWLRHRAEGRAYVYSAVRSREQAGSSSLREFIERVFGGDRMRLLQHLVDEPLSAAEAAALQKMIDERAKEDRDAEP